MRPSLGKPRSKLTAGRGADTSCERHAASRSARILLTSPDGVSDLAGVPPLLPVVVVGLATVRFWNAASRSLNVPVDSRFTFPAESRSAELASVCN